MEHDIPAGADTYDRWFDEPWGRYAFAIEAQSLRERVGPVDGDLVLESGCGTGRFAVELARAGARIVGLDIDRSMLAVAAPRHPGRLVAGDIEHLPFADAVFDVAVAVTVLEFLALPDEAFAEVVRVTRPGGRIVIAALNVCSPWGMLHRRRAEQWAAARLSSPGDLRSLGGRFAHEDEVVGSGALLAPGAVPGLRLLGPLFEWIGAWLFPQSGAFQVLVAGRR